MNALLRILALLLVLPLPARALDWKQTEISVTSAAGDKAADAVYSFENKGTETVLVIAVTTSCECTKARADKASYAPGEKGTISARFEFEGRTGEQQRTVLVLVLENGQQTASILKLNVSIPARPKSDPPSSSRGL